ncbi:MAG: rRNA methyltransferase, partial [Acidimicrobiales bacterium]|nr:rRNA methyltransferase [Acidimicrobiales bacterium]
DQVEGRRAVWELLAAGRRPVRDVWLAEGTDPAAILSEIEDLARAANVPIRRVARSRLAAEAHSEAPQGVLAHAAPLPEADLDALFRRAPGGPQPFLLAVDGVTDPQNLGALLRSAEAAGATGALLPRHRAVHVTPTVAKAAAGAVERVPMTIVGGLPTALAAAGKAGLWVVGLDAGGSTSLFDLTVGTEPVVVVLGAEGSGLSRLVRDRCDVVARIPSTGGLGSLNVAAAGVLALFEVARRRAAD